MSAVAVRLCCWHQGSSGQIPHPRPVRDIQRDEAAKRVVDGCSLGEVPVCHTCAPLR